MTNSPPRCVTIIGAGLGGLTLALALQKYGIQSKFYELRRPDYDFGGAIMLSPNALRVIDKLGVYDRICGLGYNFETMDFRTDHDHKVVGTYYFGHESLYGYKALRIYRSVLIAELRKIVSEQGISIEYGRKFSHVISEDSSGVRFAFADGTEDVAEMLVGADGIHSTVRKYIYPDIEPTYAGFLGVTYAFPTSKLRVPNLSNGETYNFPVSVMGKNGAFALAPQSPDGSEMFAGRQFRFPLQSRTGWDVLLKEKTELVSMHQKDTVEWSDFVQSAQEQLSQLNVEGGAHSLAIWPFHTVPKLDQWASDEGRVIILGDAAHAVPPTAGQGANQAFEDSYSLAVTLKSLSPSVDLTKGLGAWRTYRQSRVDKILELNHQMDNLRLPQADREKLSADEKVWQDDSKEEGEGKQLAWLYMNDIDEDMARYLAV